MNSSNYINVYRSINRQRKPGVKREFNIATEMSLIYGIGVFLTNN